MNRLDTSAGLVDRLRSLSAADLFFWRTRMVAAYFERGLIDEELEARGLSVDGLIDANLAERSRQYKRGSDFQGVMSWQ